MLLSYRSIQYALFGMDIGDIGHPFAVRSFGMKITVAQISVFVQLLTYLLPFPAATNLCQQVIFLHDAQNCLRIAVNSATATSAGNRRYESILSAAAGLFW